MNIALPELTPAQESLFLTLGSRAVDSRLPRPFLGDTAADDILAATGYGLDRFPQLTTRVLDRRSSVFDAAVRAKRLDDMVRRFVSRHRDAVVLDLGAGLDGRMARVDPPPSVDWYDVDYPAVVALRRQLLPAPANAHCVGADLTDPEWLAEIPSDRPAMLVADGLILFLTEDDFVSLLTRLTTHFPCGELALNAYTTWAIWVFRHSRAMKAIGSAVLNRGFNDPRKIEQWVDGVELVEEVFLTRAPEAAELPLITRVTSRLMAKNTMASRFMRTMVLRYRF